MKTRILAILMAALLVVMLSGCSGSNSTSEPAAAPEPAVSAEPAAASEPAAEAPPAAEPQAQEPQAPAEEAPAEPAPAEEPAPPEGPGAPEGPGGPPPDGPDSPGGPPPEGPEGPAPEEPGEVGTVVAAPAASSTVGYPLDGSVTITGWTSFFGGLTRQIPTADYNDMYIIPILSEACGVNLEYITVSETIASEQFKLMVASGDWPDYSGAYTNMYSGGLLQAFEDEVILELEDDYLIEKMPEYWAVRSALTGDDLASALENHMNLGIYTIFDGTVNDQGIAVRGDWYEELGSPDIHTLDAFTDFLYQIHDTYHPEISFHFEQGGYPGYMNDAWGMYVPTYNAASVPYYVVDDEVVTGLIADEYYEYVKWVNQLYSDGLLAEEFYTYGMSFDRFTNVAEGNLAVMAVAANSVQDHNYYIDADQEPFDMIGIPDIISEDGVYDWGTYRSRVQGCYSIPADTEHLDEVTAFMNYMYTAEGAMYGNYGEEGYTYIYDENGELHYTDMILNTTTMVENAVRGYIDEIYPVYRYAMRFYSAYNDAVMAAATTWNDQQFTTSHTYPVGASLTTAEQDSLTSRSADIMSYVSTEILSFMIGQNELNDESWANYVATLESMGIHDVLAVYQNAYNEYLAGER